MTTLSHLAPRASSPVLRHILRRTLGRLRAAVARDRALACLGLTSRGWLMRDLGLTQADFPFCPQRDLDLHRRIYWF